MTQKEMMARKEKTDWLSLYRHFVRREQRLRSEMRRWRSVAEQMTAMLRLTPGGGGGDRTAQAVEEITYLEQALADCVARQARLRMAIARALRAVTDERGCYILERHFIDGLTLHEVADEMNYSWRYMMKIYAKALEVVEAPEDWRQEVEEETRAE